MPRFPVENVKRVVEIKRSGKSLTLCFLSEGAPSLQYLVGVDHDTLDELCAIDTNTDIKTMVDTLKHLFGHDFILVTPEKTSPEVWRRVDFHEAIQKILKPQ